MNLISSKTFSTVNTRTFLKTSYEETLRTAWDQSKILINKIQHDIIARGDITDHQNRMRTSVIDHGMQKKLTECGRQKSVPIPHSQRCLWCLDKPVTLNCKRELADVIRIMEFEREILFWIIQEDSIQLQEF